MNKPTFIAELKRRNVLRMAGLYLVGAWLVVQVSATLLPVFDAPSWSMKAAVAIMAIGFIPALIFAWVFELTPEGLQRESEVERSGSIAPDTGRNIDRAIIIVLVLAIVMFAVDRFVFAPRREAAQAEALRAEMLGGQQTDALSIAVLPFEDRSGNPSDADYGDWLSELIGNQLGKAPSLRVIAQSSAATFKGQALALPEIGRKLGVRYVLEGTVRSAADGIAISAKLIEVATGTQVWTEVYQRKQGRALAVQSELADAVANAVAGRLNATIDRAERQAPTPATSQAVLEAYLAAQRLYRKGGATNVREAQRLLQTAVELDDGFAAAWALLARAHSYLFFNASEATDARRAAAQQALAKATSMAPELVEVMLADAYHQYWVVQDYDGARSRFDALSAKWPSNSDVLVALASITRRQGRWDESKGYFERAIALDPLRAIRRRHFIELFIARRDFAGARQQIDLALANWPGAPENLPFIAMQVAIAHAEGRMDEAARLLDRPAAELEGPFFEQSVEHAMLSRRPAVAIGLVETALTRAAADGTSGLRSSELHVTLGYLRGIAGDAAGARRALREALEEANAALAKQADDAEAHAYAALAHAGLGDRANAAQHAAQAVAAAPIAKDALAGAYYLDMQAKVLSYLGDRDAAIPIIDGLMRIPAPSPITPAFLRLHPAFDALRDDPRFEALMAEATR